MSQPKDVIDLTVIGGVPPIYDRVLAEQKQMADNVAREAREQSNRTRAYEQIEQAQKRPLQRG